MLYGNVVAVSSPRHRRLSPKPLSFTFDACRLHTAKYSTSSIHVAFYFSFLGNAFCQSKCCTESLLQTYQRLKPLQVLASGKCEYSRYTICNKISCSIGAYFECSAGVASVEASILSPICHAAWDVHFLENTAHFFVDCVLFFG